MAFVNGAGLFWLAVVAAALAVGYVLFRMARWAFRFRGTRLVRCPETADFVAVHVDTGHAAATGAWKEPALRLDSCTRWPAKQNCGQECLQQVEQAPEDCLVRTFVARWYRDKLCVYCGRALGEFHWPDFRCALQFPSGVTAEWRDIRPEELPAMLAHAKAVCWSCHIAETFRREHPDLVTDRPGGLIGPMGERSGTR
jgi:hypothetical protein